jgi:hypothetical protein
VGCGLCAIEYIVRQSIVKPKKIRRVVLLMMKFFLIPIVIGKTKLWVKSS